VGTLLHSCVKVCEAIKLPFEMVSGVSSGIRVLDGGPDPPRGMGGFWGGVDVGLPSMF